MLLSSARCRAYVAGHFSYGARQDALVKIHEVPPNHRRMITVVCYWLGRQELSRCAAEVGVIPLGCLKDWPRKKKTNRASLWEARLPKDE